MSQLCIVHPLPVMTLWPEADMTLSWACMRAGGRQLSLAEQAARKAAREASSFSWVLALALGLLLLVAWAQLVQRMPWLQQEVGRWRSLGGRSAANPKPT